MFSVLLLWDFTADARITRFLCEGRAKTWPFSFFFFSFLFQFFPRAAVSKAVCLPRGRASLPARSSKPFQRLLQSEFLAKDDATRETTDPGWTKLLDLSKQEGLNWTGIFIAPRCVWQFLLLSFERMSVKTNKLNFNERLPIYQAYEQQDERARFSCKCVHL